MEIKVILRNGSEYLLILDRAEVDVERAFVELAAGRSQALRGWVPVQPRSGTEQIVVLGEEIVEVHLIGDGASS